MITTLPCREAPTTKLPVTAYSETDLLAFDLRSCAARCEKLGLPEAAAVLLEISAAVEIEAARPFTPAPDDLPF
jgi:hypothetical protein